jgi:hypothetical protein
VELEPFVLIESELFHAKVHILFFCQCHN